MTGERNRPEKIATTEIDRRTALRAGSGLLAAGLVGSTAGCLDALPIPNPLGGGGYANWFYEPGTVRSRDHYDFARLEPIAMDDAEDEFDADLFGQFESFVEANTNVVDLDFDEVGTYINFADSLVIEGEYATEDVIDELEDVDFESETEHEGYEIFLRSGEAWGVSDANLVRGQATSLLSADDVVEETIDTQAGEVDRYREDVDGMETLVGRLGSATIVLGGTNEPVETSGAFEDMIAAGVAVDVNGDRSTLKRVLVWEEADDYDVEDLEDWLDDYDGSGEPFDDVDDPTVNTEGNAVVMKGKLDTDDLGFNHLEE